VSCSLDTFISVDLETTGLDSEIDRITEIGAVRYVKGVKADSFSMLVNPKISIPDNIISLTGIDNDMVKNAPPIEDAIAEFEKFLDDAPLIVGQNIKFDISFLKRYISLKYLSVIDTYFIDTAVLARLVWPGLKSFSLASLTKFISIDNKDAHRALADAEATAIVYLYELAATRKLPANITNFIAGLLFGETGRGIVLSSIEGMTDNLPSPVDYEYDYGDNVIGSNSIEPMDDYFPIETDRINEIFDNRLREVLDDYEERPQQLEMAAQVAGAFNRSELFLAEAPTGIGKSLAYLVSALMWSYLNSEGVIISTQTKNLQDQLFNKDIPLVKEALRFDFKAVLLKGRGNYLCLFKYYELLREAISSFDADQRHALLPLVVWAETTKTGDIAECGGFNPGRNRYLWTRISCEGNFCLGRMCRYYKRCFLIRVRNEALTAHLRIINHHLFFADFASGGELVRATGHAIMDEAHNLEKVAASYLGPEINPYLFNMFFNQIYMNRPTETGFIMLAKLNVSKLAEADSRKINSLISKVQKSMAIARNSLTDFFDKLAASILKQRGRNNESKEIRYYDLTKYIDKDKIETGRLSLLKLESTLIDLSDELDFADSLDDKNQLVVRCRSLAQDLTELRSSYEFLVYPENNDYVYWIDLWKRREIKLISAPIEVGKLLDEQLYDHLKTLILSSATLSAASNFSFLKRRLGLDLSSSERTCELALGSPFDLDKNIGFFEAGFMPVPNSPEFNKSTAAVIGELFNAVRVKGMVLFTSYKSITSVVSNVGQKLLSQGFELFVQDNSLSPFQLLSRYRQSSKGIIFGTDSFWEGVDLPGAELELLIIVKLPFAVPDRPWIKANLDKIEADGGNSFIEFSLPEAVIKFRQGFGRLIRKKSDRGCVVMLDSRLSGKKYGRYFSASVKPQLQYCRNLESLIDGVKQHFDE